MRISTGGGKKPAGFDERLQHSLELLRKSEKLAKSLYAKGYYLAFSGGKDSQALYHAAVMAGVKFEPHYNLTTLDPPELVRFIRNKYPDVIIDRPELTFLQLCIKKKALPTQKMRFCCAELKETNGAGTVTLTGVRRQESTKRAKRNEVEVSRRAFSGTAEQFDQFTRDREMEPVQCVNGKDKIIINPIIEWSEADVWYFLKIVVKAESCQLYAEGWKRIGCLFCPMSNTKCIRRDTERYPKYKNAILRTIHKLRENGYANEYQDLTDSEVFDWWVSKKGLKTWYFDNKVQLKLFDDNDF